MLEKLLNDEIHGIQRVPALCFANPQATLEELNLKNYEVLGCEPLHDVTGHVKNIFEAIPVYLEKTQKELFYTTLEVAFEGKDAKRGCDYRVALIKLAILLEGKISLVAHKILTTMCEIQDILYSREEYRTNQTILRLHNVTFNHAILLNDFFKDWKKQSKITQRKLFGKYYHAVIKHSSEQYRILSGRSANTEDEERTFHYLKSVSTLTSNHHPENVILNAIIRTQAREFITGNSPNKDYQSEVTKLYTPLKEKREESSFKYSWIAKNKHAYQAHLERIADFLVEKQLYWEEKSDGVTYHDLNDIASKKQKHNFRSWTMQEEADYLKSCWDTICIPKADILIPTCSIKIEHDDESVSIKRLNTLEYFNENDKNEFDHQEAITEDQYQQESGKYIEEEVILTEVVLSLQPVKVLPPPPPLQTSTPTTQHFEKNPSQKYELVTQTAKVLSEILGLTPDVKRYDMLRRSYKQSPSNFKKVELKKIHARIEVKLLNANETLKLELTQIEEKILKNSKALNVVAVACEDKDEQKKLLKKLKYIRALRTEFQI